MGKRDVFELLDRDCVNSQTTEFIKNYINDITTRNNNYAMKNKNLGVELSRVQRTLNEERKLNDGFEVSDAITKLKQRDLNIREDYLDADIVKLYVERRDLELEDTGRTLSEFLIDNYELQQFYLKDDYETINNLQHLLMKIRQLDNTSNELKKEIDNAIIGMF